ncbi:MAG: MBL fold metallo-hydrolase [Acidobacteria bacterium]|jgi:glyoxylase-like metal-dependent hydrolase (beta-lactamase superfamily II)|nr:MBL fold metallo-hydrolase [Acidobacteriota bacterium]
MKIIPLAIPTPFYIGDVNVYLIKEEPLTLIDVGPKTEEAANVLREKLRASGVALEDIRRIVLTHAHEDHCGLAKQVREAAKDAEIFVHNWETGHLFGRLAREEYKNLMLSAGVPLEVFDEIQKIYADVSLLTDKLNEGEFSALEDEMELEFASGSLKVLHTPGHTPGSCSFFREANRTLFAGDCVLKRITPNPMFAPDPFDAAKRFKSLAEFLVSLARIRALAPTLIYGGHGEPIFDFDEVFHRYVRAIDERQKDTVDSIEKTSGASAWETAKKLFPEAIGKGVHQFLAISEAVAHLDYAESQGKIAVEIKEGAEIYRKL